MEKLAQICQVCGHEEDLEECPECSRYTCQPCFNDINEQGVEGKSCLYCGHVWFMPEKPAPKVLQSGNLSTNVRGDSYSTRFGLAVEAEDHFTRARARDHADVNTLTNQDGSTRAWGSVDRAVEPGDLLSVSLPEWDASVARLESTPISSTYDQVMITLMNRNGEPFDLTGGEVTWGNHHGSIGHPQLGEVRFTISRDDPVRRNEPIEINQNGIIYKVRMNGTFDSLQMTLPQPDEARRLIGIPGRYDWDAIHEKLKGNARTRKQVRGQIFEAKDMPLGTLNRWLNKLVDEGHALKKSQAYAGQDIFYVLTDEEFAAGNVREDWPPPPTTEAYRTVGGERFDWELAFVKFMISIGGLGVLLILIGLFGL